MGSLRNIPIKRKLRVVILGTCSAALVVACGTLFALQLYFFRQNFVRELSSLAEIVGNSSTAALEFRDASAAGGVLAALCAKPHISGAALLMRDGSPLAQRGIGRLPKWIGTQRTAGLHTNERAWLYVYPVHVDGERVGTLILEPDYHTQANSLFRVYAGILVAVLATSFLVAVLISWRLEQLILRPIQSLAGTARTISRRNDYSVRAEKLVEDELGSFTDSFNAMLGQIESRDASLRHEIAERTRAEEELQRMQQQLIDASRQAGMAEVATGVLHNVGNVLNSVNVSATLLTEKLTKSKVANLSRAAALLRAGNSDLPHFLADDPKGKLLPGYFANVGEHLAREREEALNELSRLNKNIEHIKDIVARQQTYARHSRLIEELFLEDLVEDAIRMNIDSFGRHGIVISREYGYLPPTAVDRHQVLQIVINLLRNAKQAMKEPHLTERRMTIRLFRNSGDFAELQVADTGIGIPEENLTRVFSHGFTTRPDGHGFGLHSAAVAAQEMGGRLSAESSGPGGGATFILQLPLAQSDTVATIPTSTAAA